MASIRKRTWKSSGEDKTAWIADYLDQGGKRHIKTFARQKDAKDWLVTAQGEVQRGVHTPENASITVAVGGRSLAAKRRAGEAGAVDGAPVPQSRLPTHQPADWPREAGPA